MSVLPKKTALALGVPLAALCLFGGSVAFAASQGGDSGPSSILAQEPSPTTTPPATDGGPDPATPATPKTPRSHDSADCPNMGGEKGADSGTGTGTSSGASTQTNFRTRGGPRSTAY
ncbi:hypothetical protein AYO38_07325 [bacterium SCGC AG-212-C10]|nr:hypothetical protein AYO38_07325 [bacterium SCGC AG-212-C10]